MKNRSRAKQVLKTKGWSYRAAAPVLGVTYQHLSQVLNGHRDSNRLLTRITTLPLSPSFRGVEANP